MADILWPTRQNIQPIGPARVEKSSALSRDLLCAVLPSRRVDSFLDKLYTQDGAYSLSTTRVGQGLATNGSNSAIWLPIPPVTLTKYTLFGIVQSNSNAIDTRCIALGFSTNSSPIVQIGAGVTTASKIRLYLRSNSNTTPSVDVQSTADGFDGSLHTVAITYDGSIITCYIDGVLDSTNSFSSASMTVDRFAVGTLRRSANAAFWAGSTFLAAAWSRCLTTPEIESLSNNPWQIFRAPDQRVFGTQATSIISADGSSSGAGTINAITNAIWEVYGSATGEALADSSANALWAVAGNSSNSASVSSVAHAIYTSQGTSSGSSTVTAAINAIYSVEGLASGSATSSATSNTIWVVVGSSSGTSFVNGQTAENTYVSADGLSSGNSSVDAVARLIVQTVGDAASVANADASTLVIKITEGSSNSVSTVQAITQAIFAASGNSVSSVSSDAITQAVAGVVGSSSGTSTVDGVGTNGAATSISISGGVTVTILNNSFVTTLIDNNYSTSLL